MRVLHCCLSCFYIDDYTYQENMLIQEHVKEGHDVLVLASTETYDESGSLSYLQPSTYIGSDGALVKRLPYKTFLPTKMARKIRTYSGLYEEINLFSPDVIMFHGMCSYDLLTVSRYVKKNPSVRFYADSHEDFNNSARTFLSRNILYRFFYLPIIKLAIKNISKVFYITYETKQFCKKMYELEDEKLEYFPLGGILLDDNHYLEIRNKVRMNFKVSNDQTVFVQTGKFDENKKLKQSLEAFRKIKDKSFRFYIAGVIPEEYKDDVYSLIEADIRIVFLGWVNMEKLIELLCMCDIYLQPGSQSATMQMSLALRCAVVLDNVPSHQHIFCSNGALVSSKNDLEIVLNDFAKNPNVVKNMQTNSYDFAKKFLDYSKLSKRLLK